MLTDCFSVEILKQCCLDKEYLHFKAMSNSKGMSNYRNVMLGGRHSLLPPKSPFPSASPAYPDYVPTGVIGQKTHPKPRDGNVHHQRTSSESFLLEEQPSWLDDLLNEPETPVRKAGHRRSSSDSFAYVDVASASNLDYAAPDEYRYKNLVSVPSWASQDFDARQTAYYAESNLIKPKHRAWESPVSALNHPNNLHSARENPVMQNAGSAGSVQEGDGRSPATAEKLESAEAGPHDFKPSSEKKDNHAKATSETDTKRAKQYVVFISVCHLFCCMKYVFMIASHLFLFLSPMCST